MSGEDMGVAATPPGHQPSASEPHGSSCKHGVPDADTLIALMSAWSCLPGTKFHAAYPFFQQDIERIAREYELGLAVKTGHPRYLEAVALLFSDYADDLYWSAQAIEARRAETGEDTGSVHESAVGEADAPESTRHDH